MTPQKIAQISKYMTIWFKKHTDVVYNDFSEIPTEYALLVAKLIESSSEDDLSLDKQFGNGFSSYMRTLLQSEKEESLLERELPTKQASVDKFG